MKLNSIILIVIVLFCLGSCGRSYEETRAVRQDITVTVFASGILEAANSYELTARTDGYIEKMPFEENDLVSTGQLMAVIDNQQNHLNAQSAKTLYRIAQSNTESDAPLLIQAHNTVALAQQQMKQDSIMAAKYKLLSEANAVARVEYDTKLLNYQNAIKEYRNAIQQYNFQKKQAEEKLIVNKAQKNINQTVSSFSHLKALKSGKVYKKLKEIGDFIRQGEAIALIGDAEELYAKVNIDEQSIGKVKVGQEAMIELNINNGRTYKGKIAEILPTFDEVSQSFLAKIIFIDSLDFTIANTQLQANIIIETVEDAMLIPRRFLSYGNEVTIKGEEMPTKIQTKIVSSKWVQVTSGLDDSSVIVHPK